MFSQLPNTGAAIRGIEGPENNKGLEDIPVTEQLGERITTLTNDSGKLQARSSTSLRLDIFQNLIFLQHRENVRAMIMLRLFEHALRQDGLNPWIGLQQKD